MHEEFVYSKLNCTTLHSQQTTILLCRVYFIMYKCYTYQHSVSSRSKTCIWAHIYAHFCTQSVLTTS